MARLRLNNMQPAFRHFLKQSQGFSGGKLTPLDAVCAMCGFFAEQPLSPAAGRGADDDTLLFQISPPRTGSPALVNITRQAYRGAGRSVQLSLDVVCGDVDPSRGEHFTLWSTDVAGDDFASVVLSELAGRGVLFESRPLVLRVDRF